MGVPDEKIFLVPYSVDNERFVQSAKLTAEQRAASSQAIQRAGRPAMVLYAAKFTQRKRPVDLLEAARRLRWRLIPDLLGHGWFWRA